MNQKEKDEYARKMLKRGGYDDKEIAAILRHGRERRRRKVKADDARNS